VHTSVVLANENDTRKLGFCAQIQYPELLDFARTQARQHVKMVGSYSLYYTLWSKLTVLFLFLVFCSVLH